MQSPRTFDRVRRTPKIVRYEDFIQDLVEPSAGKISFRFTERNTGGENVGADMMEETFRNLRDSLKTGVLYTYNENVYNVAHIRNSSPVRPANIALYVSMSGFSG
jgi:hypothetical protein